MDIQLSKSKLNQKLLEESFTVIPFEEALKNVEYENSDLEIKSSISKLLELLQCHNIIPKFDLIESKLQQSIFKYRVSFYYDGVEYFETGSGNSKQEAKNASAKALLDKLNFPLFSFNQCNEGQQQESRNQPITAVKEMNMDAAFQTLKIYKDFIQNTENQIEKPLSEQRKTRNQLVMPVKKLTIEEAFKNMTIEDSCGNQNKTPVSKLQEFLVSHGMLAPIYESIPCKDLFNKLSFSYRVSLNYGKIQLTEIGIGRSKKEAKHAAAQALIDKLNLISMEIKHSVTHALIDELKFMSKKIKPIATEPVIDKLNCLPEEVKQDAAQPLIDKLNCMTIKNNEITLLNNRKRKNFEENPIGILQELCVAKYWPLPVYELEKEFGPLHEKQFSIICTMRQERTIGIGTSKKIAKRLAASKMLNKLKNVEEF